MAHQKSHPEVTRHGRFAALDLLRLAAAIAVLFSHWSFTFPARHAAHVLYPLPGAEFGWLGVELFFLISGFVILMSAAGVDAKRFIQLRAIRLYPGFWICCTFTTAVTGTWLLLPANLTMLPSLLGTQPIDDVYWTLLVEIKFYALVAAVLYLGLIDRAEQLLWLWLLLTWANLAPLPRQLLEQEFGCYFIGGATCYLVARDGPSPSRNLLFLLSWIFGVEHAIGRAETIGPAFATEISPAAVAIIVSVFFAAMHLVATRQLEVRPSRVTLAIGGLTYPLYLLHDEIGRAMLGVDGPKNLVFWGAFAAMLALSFAVWSIERPIMAALRRRLAR